MLKTLPRDVIQINKRISKSVARMWPHERPDIFDAYDRCVGRYAERVPTPSLVADVGAGNRSPFRKYITKSDDVRVVGVDVADDAMIGNGDLDEKRVANIVESLPFADSEVDLLVSRSVLEHLPDVDKFVANSARVVRPGGYSIHVFPCRYAHFSLINRLIPNTWTRGMMRYLYPKNVSGFPAFYDRCYFSGVRKTFMKYGFDVIEYRISYHAYDYYYFFFPLFLVVILYESIIKALRLKNLGATMLVVAQKQTESVERT